MQDGVRDGLALNSGHHHVDDPVPDTAHDSQVLLHEAENDAHSRHEQAAEIGSTSNPQQPAGSGDQQAVEATQGQQHPGCTHSACVQNEVPCCNPILQTRAQKGSSQQVSEVMAAIVVPSLRVQVLGTVSKVFPHKPCVSRAVVHTVPSSRALAPLSVSQALQQPDAVMWRQGLYFGATP
jgi:hypothetical protein